MGCGRAAWGLVVAVIATSGCHVYDKHKIDVPLVEEFRAPPDEERFNNPPEQGYKKPPPKKEFKPGFGGPNGPSGGSMPPSR